MTINTNIKEENKKKKKENYKSIGSMMSKRDFETMFNELSNLDEEDLQRFSEKKDNESQLDLLLFNIPHFAVKIEKNEKNNEMEFTGELHPYALNCINLLLKLGADPNLWMKYGESCFLNACETNNIEILELLMNNEYIKADPKIQDHQTKNGLYYAAKSNADKTIDYLVKKLGFNINEKNFLVDDETPIFFACKYNNMKAFDMLVENGANLTIKNSFGKKCYEKCLQAYDEETQVNGEMKDEEIALWIDLFEKAKELTEKQLAEKKSLKPISKIKKPI